MKFSFSDGPLSLILDQLSGLYPTATRFIALENSGLSSTQVRFYDSDQQELSDGGIRTDIPDLAKLFSVRNNPFVWQNESDLPFSWAQVRQSNNVDMFRELERNVLVLRVNNPSWMGFILIYFSKNKKHFGFLDSESSFSHENREIIGQTAGNAIQLCLKNAARDSQVLDSIQKSMQALTGNRKMEDRGNQNQVKLLENMIVEMAVEYLHNLSRDQKISLALSPDAREKIQSFRGSPASLRSMLNQASVLAVNLCQSVPVIIESWHLISGAAENEEDVDQPISVIQHRHMKIYQWLDRIEEAVKMVISGHENPTGVLVGKAMQPAVSAPAISDMMNKQKQKIMVLLNEFPDRWPQTRNHFKPLQNLLIRKDFDESKSA